MYSGHFQLKMAHFVMKEQRHLTGVSDSSFATVFSPRQKRGAAGGLRGFPSGPGRGVVLGHEVQVEKRQQ